MPRKVKMLSSHEGSVDGRHVQWYLEGQTYEISESLAAIFLKEGWAEDFFLPYTGDEPAAPDGERDRVSVPKAEGEPKSSKHKRK